MGSSSTQIPSGDTVTLTTAGEPGYDILANTAATTVPAPIFSEHQTAMIPNFLMITKINIATLIQNRHN